MRSDPALVAGAVRGLAHGMPLEVSSAVQTCKAIQLHDMGQVIECRFRGLAVGATGADSLMLVRSNHWSGPGGIFYPIDLSTAQS